MQISKADARAISEAEPIEPGVPLWKLAPTRDEDGRPVSDFMMLIPRLGRQAPEIINACLQRIQAVLAHYREVVFANFNMKLNVLWVSVRNRPGITLEIATAIKLHVPQALLVAPKLEP